MPPKLPALILIAAAASIAQPALAQPASVDPAARETVTLTPAQLFEFADSARDRGDFATAETAYRALSTNPDLELRSEARFRLGMMLAERQHRYADAAIEFRKILDEKPKAGRVRVELARMHAQLGNNASAAREFRAAEAAGLPPEVRQAVRFYANAFEAQKRFGASFGVALAPDTNINRATKADSLGTVIGNFTLDDDAKARSGLGLQLRGQAYLRQNLDSQARLLVQASAQGNLYREAQFNDVIVALQAGPEFQSGKDRIYAGGTASWRWYGGVPFSLTTGISANLHHPMGRRGQLTVELGFAQDDNRLNDLQDATVASLAIGYDRAFSASLGGGLSLTASRNAAKDPGYALTSGGIGAYLFKELGQTTAVLNLGYSHVEADQRLFLYPRRRSDNLYSAALGLTFRKLRLGYFVPLARARYERNVSTVEIYDYSRFSGELGLTAAF